jgi:hypothetical protein
MEKNSRARQDELLEHEREQGVKLGDLLANIPAERRSFCVTPLAWGARGRQAAIARHDASGWKP